MAKRKKSMLEAFKTAGGITPPKPQERPMPISKPVVHPLAPAAPSKPDEIVPLAKAPAVPAPAAPVPKEAASSGGPFAQSAADEPAPSASAPSARPVEDADPMPPAAASPSFGLKAPSSALVWILLALIVFSFSIAAYWGKQKTEAAGPGAQVDVGNDATENAGLGGIHASATNTPGGSPSSTNPTGSGAEQRPPRKADPLLDPANLFTVVLITLGGGQTDLAAASRDFVRDSGLPVNRILSVKNKLVVCAGAAPTRAELEGLAARIQKLSLNGERGVYSDAFIDSINKYIDR